MKLDAKGVQWIYKTVTTRNPPPYSPDLNPDELVWNHLIENCVNA